MMSGGLFTGLFVAGVKITESADNSASAEPEPLDDEYPKSEAGTAT
jgi:hypothetical protein